MEIGLFAVFFVASFLLEIIVLMNYDEFKDGRPMFALSTGMWLMIMLFSLHLEVPYVNQAGTVSTQVYQEIGINAFCLAFIFLNLLYMYGITLSIRELKKKRLL